MTIKHIPGVDRPNWLNKKWLVEAVGSIPPLVVAGIAAYRFWLQPDTTSLGYLSAGAVLWLLIASVVKVAHAREQDREASAKRDHDGLKAALLVLQASAGNVCGLDPQDKEASLRITFHRVVPPLDDAQLIEQIVPYVGGAGGGEGRKFSIRSGITGLCIRTKQPHTMHRQDENLDSYRRALEAEWSYTRADAARLSTGCMSSMAIPVLDDSGHHALGVIYLDAKARSLFTDQAVQSAILEACAGVTRYVSERYGK